ncbi:hypothetical protein GIB67_006752 [Kingdonia uniflora]|uniref:C2 domain-containing protein n=1 Tax=Kingdonia uniflora TaxID=39325 RepID=A0A7J7LYU5_9MAGN|nr:hypothetical protein GIB67_006752 [Kingdonia uniflora]
MGIQGHLLHIKVVGCKKLKDTEWITKQDPYVCLEYGSSKCCTRICSGGGKNPIFREDFVFTLIEGIQEMDVVVWNSHNFSSDTFICTGRVQLHKVISEGSDDSTWPLQTKTGRNSGEIRLKMHYPNAKRHDPITAPSPQHYAVPVEHHVPPYGAPLPGFPPFYPHHQPITHPPQEYGPYGSYPEVYAPPRYLLLPKLFLLERLITKQSEHRNGCCFNKELLSWYLITLKLKETVEAGVSKCQEYPTPTGNLSLVSSQQQADPWKNSVEVGSDNDDVTPQNPLSDNRS